MRNGVDSNDENLEGWGIGLAALALLGLTILTYVGPISSGLFHDDWYHFYEVSLGEAPALNLDDPRPLHLAPWKIAGQVFGDWLEGYYWLLFAVHWLTALAVFGICRSWTRFRSSLLVATVFLVYPADAARLWLSSIPGRFSLLFVLLAVLLIEMCRQSTVRNRGPAIATALVLLGIALLMYELPLGLIIIWPLVAHILGRPWNRFLVTLWETVPIVFLAWRFLIRPHLGLEVSRIANFVFEPVVVTERAFRVAFNLFVEGWRIGLREWVLNSQVGATAVAMASIAVVAAVVRSRQSGVEERQGELPRIFLVGLILVVAGIAPIVATDHWIGRNAGTFASRIFASAIPGAALMISVVLGQMKRRRSLQVVATTVVLTTGVCFYWEIRSQAVDNARTQQNVALAISESNSAISEGDFLVILELPPNRLAYDTPSGFGRMIARAVGDSSVSGIGIPFDRDPTSILRLDHGRLMVHERWGKIPLARIKWLKWENGILRPAGAALPETAPR